MKLLRYGPVGKEKPGLLDVAGQIRDLSGFINDIGGATVGFATLAHLAELDHTQLPLVAPDVRLGPCLSHVPNFLCIGLNYAQHAAESGMELPAEPIVFSKASSALSGPNDPIILPCGSQKTDWEIELGVVIGADTYCVAEAQALDQVAGYCIVNDVSERAFQIERGGQWIKGKSAPSFGPIGPWLVTADEVPDPQRLGLRLSLNGVQMQNGDTSDMVFSVAQIISYLSQFMRLMPGDIIATGTPAGVGMGQNPPRFLRPGDELLLEVDGLGLQRQSVARG